MMQRIPFQYGLFYHAMIGIIGRPPDYPDVQQSFHGSYHFAYQPRNDDDRKLFHDSVAVIAEWLDHFDLVFSGTVCHFGHSVVLNEMGEVLEIRIQHEVPKSELFVHLQA